MFKNTTLVHETKLFLEDENLNFDFQILIYFLLLMDKGGFLIIENLTTFIERKNRTRPNVRKYHPCP